MCLAHQTSSAAIDPAAFAGDLLQRLNHAAFCLMASIGHRTGLFDTMAAMAPAPVEDIATQARLAPRYVQEWLHAMVAARVVHADTETGRYHLPAAHAAFLTRAAGANNLAAGMQFIAVLGAVEDDVVECFRHGGGVPYGRYARFHDVMAEESSHSVVGSLDAHVLPLLPGLVERLECGIDVLDVGCGRGRALLHLAARFPNSRFTGMDLSAPTIEEARDEARALGLSNLDFERRDLTDFDVCAPVAAFDLVTAFDAIHDQARPARVLGGIRRALRDGGQFLMQDINGSGDVLQDREHPLGAYLYTISCMHCMTVSLAQGGDGLGAMWGEPQTRAHLAAAGFADVAVHRLDHDIINNWYVATA